MRASSGKRQKPKSIARAKQRLNFTRYLTRTDETIYVGLVGGSDPASIALRRAQGFLRFDRRPSYFSHAFLFTGRDDQVLECRVVDADPMVPEEGGVYKGSANERYGDVRAFPNAAIVGYRFLATDGGESPNRRVKRVLDAARNTVAIRERYDLWEMVAGWQRFLFEPDRTANPLAGELPHPGAAFVRWALEAGGIEAAPSALNQFDAPEHIWAAALWWTESYADRSVGVDVQVQRHIRDEVCAVVGP